MKKVIEKFQVEYLEVLDAKGKCDKRLEPKLSKEQLLEMYKWFVLTRVFDATALKLQREGRLGTYAESIGEEAVMIGAAAAMKKNDWLFPSYRDHGAMIARGMPLKNMFLVWRGSEEGFRIPPEQRVFPLAIPVGTQPLHAVGASWAMKIKKEKAASVVFFGDGATSTGDVHEAMNFAAVFKTPTVFVCRNNQFAISLPLSKQTAAKTLAQKAIGYGFEGVQVDGNDILGVYVAVKDALARAYAGKGPTFIEAITCRRSAHTTADDPTRYISRDFAAKCSMLDPLERFEQYLKAKKVLTKDVFDRVHKEAEVAVTAATKEAESVPMRGVEEMFKYLYSDIPPVLKEQLDEARFFK